MPSSQINNSQFPHFSTIKPQQIEAKLMQLLTDNRERLAKILNNKQNNSWEQLIQPLEELHNRLTQFWSPINHLHSVAQTQELRAAYQNCLPKITEYSTELEQNENLFAAFKHLAE